MNRPPILACRGAITDIVCAAGPLGSSNWLLAISNGAELELMRSDQTAVADCWLSGCMTLAALDCAGLAQLAKVGRCWLSDSIGLHGARKPFLSSRPLALRLHEFNFTELHGAHTTCHGRRLLACRLHQFNSAGLQRAC